MDRLPTEVTVDRLPTEVEVEKLPPGLVAYEMLLTGLDAEYPFSDGADELGDKLLRGLDAEYPYPDWADELGKTERQGFAAAGLSSPATDRSAMDLRSILTNGI